jgi:predicted MFS family arabinose efflux permease
VLAVGLFLVGTNAFVIAGLLPDIAVSLGVHTNEVSYSITYYSLVVAIATPAVAIFFWRMSRTTLIVCGLLLFAAGGAVAASSDTLLLFTIGRIIAGFGGAALVPTATAAAASLARPTQRGRALAFVGIGFTLASALGSPLGTALGAVGGWRLPLWILVGIALVLALVVALTIRGIPIAPAVSFTGRLAPLRDIRILAALCTTVLIVAGFNAVYIFSSTITHAATGGSGGLLSVLLLLFGIGGVVGTMVSGPAADRLGSRPSVAIALGVEILVLVAIALTEASFLWVAILFAIWGVTAFGATVPVQHRLVNVDPAQSGIAMSWYTTAMYAGIAIAPQLGAAASSIGGAAAIPIAGATFAALGLLVFQGSYLRRKSAV